MKNAHRHKNNIRNQLIKYCAAAYVPNGFENPAKRISFFLNQIEQEMNLSQL